MTPQKKIDWLSTHGPITVVCTWPTNEQQHARVDVLNGADRWTVQGFRDFSTEGSYADKYTLEQLEPIWHTILVNFDTMTGHDARRWIDMYLTAVDVWGIFDLAYVLRNSPAVQESDPTFPSRTPITIEWSLRRWKRKTIHMVNWPYQ